MTEQSKHKLYRAVWLHMFPGGYMERLHYYHLPPLSQTYIKSSPPPVHHYSTLQTAALGYKLQGYNISILKWFIAGSKVPASVWARQYITCWHPTALEGSTVKKWLDHASTTDVLSMIMHLFHTDRTVKALSVFSENIQIFLSLWSRCVHTLFIKIKNKNDLHHAALYFKIEKPSATLGGSTEQTCPQCI